MEDRNLRNNGVPFFDNRRKTWKVDLPGTGIEEGSLADVASEYVRFSLYYPFHYKNQERTDFEDHAHSFSWALRHLMHDPENFSLEGHEEYYSQQEMQLVELFRAKLLLEQKTLESSACREPGPA